MAKKVIEESTILPAEKLAYSIPEIADALGVSRSFIYMEMGAGRLGSCYAGKRRLVPRDSALAYLGSLEKA